MGRECSACGTEAIMSIGGKDFCGGCVQPSDLPQSITPMQRRRLPVPERKNDSIRPNYYRSETGHEAVDVIEAWGLNFALGNVVKYVARAGLKSGDVAGDLKKARDYINREIARVGG